MIVTCPKRALRGFQGPMLSFRSVRHHTVNLFTFSLDGLGAEVCLLCMRYVCTKRSYKQRLSYTILGERDIAYLGLLLLGRDYQATHRNLQLMVYGRLCIPLTV